jgi:hypothetical protein
MSNRRTFIKQTGGLLAATVLPLHMCTDVKNKSPKFKMGLQLFSIRDAMAEDAITTLKKVRELGYEDSELFGYDGENGTFYGIKAKEFKTIRPGKLRNSIRIPMSFPKKIVAYK